MSTGSAFIFTTIIRSPNLSISVTLSSTLASAITATPRCHVGPPAHITLYPSLTKSPPSFHLTSLTPIILNLFLRIFSLTFSNFPIAFIVLTFHIPFLISCFSSILSNPVQFPLAHIPHLSLLTALAQVLHQFCLERAE